MKKELLLVMTGVLLTTSVRASETKIGFINDAALAQQILNRFGGLLTFQLNAVGRIVLRLQTLVGPGAQFRSKALPVGSRCAVKNRR